MKKLFLLFMLALCTVVGAKAAVYSGEGNSGFNWSVDTDKGLLEFTASTFIPDRSVIFNIEPLPWKQYSKEITTIKIGKGIGKINDGVFDGLTGVEVIVFEGISLGNISWMPTIENNVFNDVDMSNVTVVVPDNVHDYSLSNSKDSGLKGVKEENIIKGEYSSGKCGDNLYWALISSSGSGTLTITGSGAMYDYTPGTAPWYDNRADIQTVEVGSEATTIGNYAFDGCTSLATVTLNSNAAIGTGAVPSSAATHLILQDKQPLLMNNNTFGSVSYV
ncbi:MAG: leucine-rich repeat protein, partial [Bacteroidaceae bacterium]|nr:leucine-rich repeat protein [Bacteroidaceae bacterium]